MNDMGTEVPLPLEQRIRLLHGRAALQGADPFMRSCHGRLIPLFAVETLEPAISTASGLQEGVCMVHRHHADVPEHIGNDAAFRARDPASAIAGNRKQLKRILSHMRDETGGLKSGPMGSAPFALSPRLSLRIRSMTISAGLTMSPRSPTSSSSAETRTGAAPLLVSDELSPRRIVAEIPTITAKIHS